MLSWGEQGGDEFVDWGWDFMDFFQEKGRGNVDDVCVDINLFQDNLLLKRGEDNVAGECRRA
ncbi:hypothetical protein JCM31598_38660 [Desulfonatronum parangueonense]